MNNMNMPGFTAEASLYRSGAHYQVGAMLAGLRQGGEVVPSARINKINEYGIGCECGEFGCTCGFGGGLHVRCPYDGSGCTHFYAWPNRPGPKLR